jgi:dolichol-phosphate mannosyltransferase
MKITLVVPAYNESEGVQQTTDSLRPVIDDLRQSHEVEVVFVNDGSRDNTVELLEANTKGIEGVKIVSHEVNRGLGAAIRTGFSNSTGDLIVTTDFDGTYSFSTIPALVQQLLDDDVDIVSASPYHPKGGVEGVPRYRLVFSFGASFLYRLLVRWRIYTWTALFRCYRRPVIENVSFDSDDFLAGTELLVKAIQAGYTVSEYPTVLRQRTFGQSSIKIARVTMAHLKFQGKVLWGSVKRRITSIIGLFKRSSSA